jgi:hypothetical protein
MEEWMSADKETAEYEALLALPDPNDLEVDEALRFFVYSGFSNTPRGPLDIE